MNDSIELIALTVALPSTTTTARTKIWRGLKAAGAAVLRDGVYVLPASPAHETTLLGFQTEVENAGGGGELLTLPARDEAQAERFRALFDRSEAFGEWLVDCRQLANERTQDLPTLERRLRTVRRQFEQIAAIDFYPGEAQAQARRELEALANHLATLLSPGEPRALVGSIARLALADYQGRTWATRARPWVDRLASAWLIRRHIDPGAHILWLASPADCPPAALGFDYDGATFSHVDGRVTFETLLASFGLDAQMPLARLGAVVHQLDVGGVPVAEAAGVAAILNGMRLNIADDDALLAAASTVFDALAAHFADAPADKV
ncbi:chromate resistance protein ChrB domain-containing protein [Chitinimonas sp.]|uniref:chromate resistance protein ChrB domain-containing protein n=1 Tax=Chitinimonas sp. TaxID=1934313 RepID=UPI0035B28B5F